MDSLDSYTTADFLPGPQVRLLDSLVNVISGQDGGRDVVMPLVEQTGRRLRESFEEQHPAPPQPYMSLMLEVVELIEDYLKSESHPAATWEYRTRINDIVARIVQQLTRADCVFVRRRYTDGRVELIGKPFWFVEQFGMPPKVKSKKEGISSRILSRPSPRPTIVPDVRSPEIDDDLKGADNAAQWPIDSPEYEFLSSIRAEACIPLMVKGKVLGGIVAIRRKPYSLEEARQIERVLSAWQNVLAFLYSYPLPQEQNDRIQHVIESVVQVLPRVTASVTDTEFLRKTAALLTSAPALSWHRALFFLFRDTYPSDAVCVMAVGATGESSWSKHQHDISSVNPTLDDYLSSAERPDFGSEDPLYRLSQCDDKPLTIAAGSFTAKAEIDRLFSCLPDQDPGYPLGGEFLRLAPDDPLLRSPSNLQRAFHDQAAECDHLIFPLTRHHPTFRPFGFVILDNPYASCFEFHTDLNLTRMVCQLIAGLMMEWGLGREGWYETYLKKRRITAEVGNFLTKYLDQPDSRAELLETLTIALGKAQ